MNNLPTVPCRVCTQPTTATALKMCEACWSVDRGLPGFLMHEEGRRIVRAALQTDGHVLPACMGATGTCPAGKHGETYVVCGECVEGVVECGAPVGRAHVALRPYQAEALRALSTVHVHDSITMVVPTEAVRMSNAMRAALKKCGDVADSWPDDPHKEQRHAIQGIVGEALVLVDERHHMPREEALRAGNSGDGLLRAGNSGDATPLRAGNSGPVKLEERERGFWLVNDPERGREVVLVDGGKVYFTGTGMFHVYPENLEFVEYLGPQGRDS